MCCPFVSRGLALLASLTFVIAFSTTCTGTGSTAAVGTSGEAAPFDIEVSQLYITVANRTGVPVVDTRVEIIPAGRMTIFKTSWPRLEIGDKRDFMLNSFNGTDGTPFRRGIVRARRVKVSGKDLSGKLYEYEVPFN